MKKEELLQARKVNRARRAIYTAESKLSLDDYVHSDIHGALDALYKILPKHIRKTEFKKFHIQQVKVQPLHHGDANHRWVHANGGFGFITLNVMTRLIRSIVHRINQQEESTNRGSTSITPPEDNNTLD